MRTELEELLLEYILEGDCLESMGSVDELGHLSLLFLEETVEGHHGWMIVRIDSAGFLYVTPYPNRTEAQEAWEEWVEEYEEWYDDDDTNY